MRINLGLGLRGPDIRPGPDNRYLIIEGHGRALNVIECHERSWNVFSHYWINIEKSYWYW